LRFTRPIFTRNLTHRNEIVTLRAITVLSVTEWGRVGNRSVTQREPPPDTLPSGRNVYARSMRVEVNADLCQGHNRCYALAPELFDVDDYGAAVVIGDGSVAADLEDKARLAVANCPEYAITISDDA